MNRKTGTPNELSENSELGSLFDFPPTLRVQMLLTQMSELATKATIAEALAGAVTQTGATLASLSDESPLLLVFLRHFG